MRLPRRLAPLALSALLLGVAANSTRAEPKEREPLEIEVPVGVPIQLDGALLDAECEGAAEYRIHGDGTTLRTWQYRGTLFLGIVAPRAWAEHSRFWLMFTADEEGAGLYQDGAVTLDFEALRHDRPHLKMTRRTQQTDLRFDGEAVARAQLLGDRFTVEVAIGLKSLGITGDAVERLRFAILWIRPSPQRYLTWPPGLDMSAGPTPPRDTATSARWVRLGGWEQPDGPGAYSEQDWAALVEEDRDLTRRGLEAHAFGKRIAEERQLPKEDATQVPVLEGGLRWIAARERLTSQDLLLLARGYRFLNRTDEALAVLDSLDVTSAWRGGEILRYERALTLESAGRYAESGELWRLLDRKPGRPQGSRYAAMVQRAEERHGQRTQELAARAVDEAAGDLPLVLLRTTRGNVVVLLHQDDVPNGVASFLSLARRHEGDRGFFDGTLFHRVVGDFLVQGGDPASREEGCDEAGGSMGPSTATTETNNRHGFWRGAVGFARGIAMVNGCQFFILVSPRPELHDEGYTCFGHVVSGMDVVDRIERCDELIEVRVLAASPEEPPPSEEER